MANTKIMCELQLLKEQLEKDGCVACKGKSFDIFTKDKLVHCLGCGALHALPNGNFDWAVSEEGEVKKEMVNHPTHYNEHPTGIECIDVIEAFNFNLGSSMKYIWRAGLKSPDPIEDINKALWYLDRERARIIEERKQAKK